MPISLPILFRVRAIYLLKFLYVKEYPNWSSPVSDLYLPIIALASVGIVSSILLSPLFVFFVFCSHVFYNIPKK